MPDGIEVDLDATYAAMFTYKSKNYALLMVEAKCGYRGRLESRGLEPFERRYMEELITLLLKGQRRGTRRVNWRTAAMLLQSGITQAATGRLCQA